MKKKIAWIIVSILAIIGIAIGGWTMHQYQEKQKMIQIATSEEAKKIYESHMKMRDSNAFTTNGIIKSYKIDIETLEYNPMGGMEVRIYVNNERDLCFQFGIVKNDKGDLESSGYVTYPKLSSLLRNGK